MSVVHEYNSVRNSLLWAGFRRVKGHEWSMLWSRHQTEAEIAKHHNPYKKLNHWPASWCIGRKDRLARNVARLQRRHGEAFDIAPKTFLLPTERAKLKAAMVDDPKALWILKPTNASCGRGIRLVSGASSLSGGSEGTMATTLPPAGKRYVAQAYVKRPYLINNRKFDLRIYVLVTSLDPLRIYVYQDGLVRFATQEYSTKGSAQGNRFAHLTNYSVNKKSKSFDKNQDASADGSGSKWSLTALMRYFDEHGVDSARVRQSIHDVCVKTILAGESDMATLANSAFKGGNALAGTGTPCFELYGVDVILDSALRPWLLEVNVSPSLSSSSPMDKRIKTMLVTDAFHLIGFVPYDPQKAARAAEASRQSRLQGLSGSHGGAGARRPARTARAQASDLAHMKPSDLSPLDIATICELEDEFVRRGHFTRVFPTKTTARKYGAYFETPRYNNLLMDMWLGKWKKQLNGKVPPAGAEAEGQVSGSLAKAASIPSPPEPRTASRGDVVTPIQVEDSEDGGTLEAGHSPELPVTVRAAAAATPKPRRRPRSGVQQDTASRPPSGPRRQRQPKTGHTSRPPSARSSASSADRAAAVAMQRAADAARLRKATTARRIQERFSMYRSKLGPTSRRASRPASAHVLPAEAAANRVYVTASSAPVSPRQEQRPVHFAAGAVAAIRSQRAAHETSQRRQVSQLFNYHGRGVGRSASAATRHRPDAVSLPTPKGAQGRITATPRALLRQRDVLAGVEPHASAPSMTVPPSPLASPEKGASLSLGPALPTMPPAHSQRWSAGGLRRAHTMRTGAKPKRGGLHSRGSSP